MTGASTTREDVEALAKRLKRDIDWRPGSLCEQAAATLRALLDERDADHKWIAAAESAAGHSRASATSLAMTIDAIVAERDAARARIEELSAEAERMRAALEPFTSRMMDSVQTDLQTAHQLRGGGASEAMRDDDRDLRADLRKVVAQARAALAGAPRHE